jgi:hypothetical protein
MDEKPGGEGGGLSRVERGWPEKEGKLRPGVFGSAIGAIGGVGASLLVFMFWLR